MIYLLIGAVVVVFGARAFWWWYFGIGRMIRALESIDASLRTFPTVREAARSSSPTKRRAA